MRSAAHHLMGLSVAGLFCAVAACRAFVSTSGLSGGADGPGTDGGGRLDGATDANTSADATDAGTESGPKPFPATTLLDDFNRSPGPLGGKWTTITGTDRGDWVVESAHARFVQGGGSGCGEGIVYFNTSFGASQEIYATIAVAPAYGNLALAAKIDPVSGRGVTASYDFGAKTLEVRTLSTSYTTVPVSLDVGDRFGARFYKNGDVELFKNGGRIGNLSITEDVSYGGYLAVYGSCASSPAPLSVDDFGGGDLP